MKDVEKFVLILILSVFTISMVAATAYAVSTPEQKVVEFKEKKVVSYKVKWDANGGKVGSKKAVTTIVKKGAKVKLPKTPKMTRYTFVGWYSKEVGGSKITKNTKVKKSITYYAQWKRILSTEEKKLAGEYASGSNN